MPIKALYEMYTEIFFDSYRIKSLLENEPIVEISL